MPMIEEGKELIAKLKSEETRMVEMFGSVPDCTVAKVTVGISKNLFKVFMMKEYVLRSGRCCLQFLRETVEICLFVRFFENFRNSGRIAAFCKCQSRSGAQDMEVQFVSTSRILKHGQFVLFFSQKEAVNNYHQTLRCQPIEFQIERICASLFFIWNLNWFIFVN